MLPHLRIEAGLFDGAPHDDESGAAALAAVDAEVPAHVARDAHSLAG